MPDPIPAESGSNQITEREPWLLAAIAVATAAIAIDFVDVLHGAAGVLYLIAILLAARSERRKLTIGFGAGCAILAAAGFLAQQHGVPFGSDSMVFALQLAAIGMATGLSSRDRPLRAIMAEQERILDLIHDAVIITDTRGIIEYWNAGAERLFGWSRSEALGKSHDQLLKSRSDERAAQPASDQDGQWSGELVRQRRDGADRVLHSRHLARLGSQGEAAGLIEISQDLTEQHEAEHALQIAERRYRSLFNAAGFAVWETDWSEVYRRLTAALPADADPAVFMAEHPELVQYAAEGAVIRDCNKAAIGLLEAQGTADFINSNIASLYTAATRATLAQTIGAFLRGRGEVECEIEWQTFTGRIIEMVYRVSLVPDGELWSRVIVVALDVTERKRTQARLAQVSAELAHAARVSVLGQLTASIAHEVNQPLAAIANYGKSGQRWLSRTPPDIGETQNCLERIVANAARAAETIARVRALARKAPPKAEPVDIGAVIGEALALISREARSAGAAVSLFADPDLPSVSADRVQIQQVVVNLLMNGLHAMADVEGRPREIDVSIRRIDAEHVAVSVRDYGSGIKANNPNQIFEPFYTTKSDGMGMGLSICRSIIEAQGGRIGAANNSDFGATVTFTLPIVSPPGTDGP